MEVRRVDGIDMVGGMAAVEILSECETDHGWTFRTQVIDGEGALYRHDLHLSWADYNLWSSGADAPQSVAAAVLGLLSNRLAPGTLRASFDASLARRLVPDADEQIPKWIQAAG